MKPIAKATAGSICGATLHWIGTVILLAVCLLVVRGVHAAVPTITVIGVDSSGSQTAVGEYRWTIEEDVTKASVPSQHATRDNYSFSFHSSYMPVVAAGRAVGGSVVPGPDCSDPTSVRCLDPDRGYMAVPDLDASKRYYISILPTDGYAMGGAPIAPGQTSVTIYVNKYPVPTAQISVFVFEDNSPLNAAPDLPQELGLAGFTILLTEAGGTYGGSGGQVTQDAFGNPLGTTYQYGPDGQAVLDGSGSPIMVSRGSGIVLSGTNGVATIKNLFPAKYTIQVIPPAGSDWHQTTTIEGTKGDDAWVKNGEPSFFQEFGPPGHHVFTGFTHSGFIARNGTTPVLNGSNTVTGRVVNLHNSRPPNYTFYPNATAPNATPVPKCWVGLNETGGGRALYAAPCNADSTFAIPNVPTGAWELVVWDEPLDVIIATATINVPQQTALGDVPVFSWFGRYEGRVFFDTNGNGFPDPGETGIPNQAQNIRFRDGSIYQSTLTKSDGSFAFTEVFPFFNWMIAEVDYARFKATGATVTVDAGGPIPTHNGWTTPSFNRLNPQPQVCTPADVLESGCALGAPINSPAGNNMTRTETGVVLLEGMQTFLGQTNHIEFGKKLYVGEENGGIAGIVQYGITRAEDDPKNGTAETWEPGIPRVQVNLFLDCDGDGKPDRPSATGDGTCATADNTSLSGLGYAYDPPDVDNYPFCWRDPASCGLSAPQKGAEDRKRSRTGGALVFSYGDVFTWGSDPDNGNAPYLGLGKTDGWDDAIPTGCQPGAPDASQPGGYYRVPYGSDAGAVLDCYDGLRNWNQVRPAVFDGGYAFGSVAGQTNLPNVKYIVEAVAPPGYFHQGNGDKNVVFGDQVVPTPQAPPFECVGMELPVPQYLTLFPDAQEPNPLYNGTGTQKWKKCDMKAVDMQPGRNPAPNFFLYTEAPVAGHGVGFILDDLSSEFDTNAPTFGEKHAPPHLPISIRDWTGRELSRVYADEFGSFNFLVPSTFTINPPFPSGVGPNMVVSCMNSPGPIPDPNDPARMIIDPHFNRQYSQFCYTLQYLPGKTTYLDTPVVPVAAFAGRSQNPLDCDLADATPMIYSVSGPNAAGPYVPATAGGTLTIVSGGLTDVLNPYYDPAVAGSNKLLKRDYGFGAQGPGSVVKLGAVTLTVTTWNNDMIVATVPPNAPSGQLMVTRDNGGGRLATTTAGVTVTVSDAAPKYVSAGGSIQAAIDNPLTVDGDLVIVPPGIYNEYVIMDKRVKLQGWGALSTVINASKASTTGLKNWRALISRKIDATPSNPPVIDPDTGQNTLNPGPLRTFDLLPGQVLGTNLSNNEPLLFGAEEGPGVLVVGSATAGGNRHLFTVDRARIDGLTITGADAGGGILASGYARFLEVSNNRIVSNYGTYGGGIRIGHTDLLDATNTGYGGYTNSQNGCAPNQSCALGVNIHHNLVVENGSTEAGAGGGITIGNGADSYQILGNHICGNFSMADGGGIGHLGRSDGGVIANNRILYNQTFNQSANPTGAGIFIGGEPSLDGSGLSPGTGNVTISANLIQGNNAGAGAGGGVRLYQVNGLDVSASPNSNTSWSQITLVNNIIVNNVAAYAGAGLSMLDSLRVRAINNTIANNDSTGTNQEALPAGANVSVPQPAGVVAHATNTGLLNTMSAALRAGNAFSNATLVNNIIWHNRSFCWAITGPTPPNNFGLFDANGATGCNTGSPAGTTPVYRDLAVVGVAGSLTSASDIRSGGPDPLFVSSYFNGNARPAPIITGFTTLIDTAATADEGANYIEVRYGPLTPWNCPLGSNGQPTDPAQKNCPLYGDYHIRTGSPAIDTGTNANAPATDYDGDIRALSASNPADKGADEIAGSTGGGGGPTFPTLSVLDTFNRANANTLNNGTNWQQLVTLSNSGIRVNGNQAFCANSGLQAVLCALGANAYWNQSNTAFGTSQAAAFSFANTTLNNVGLILKGSGNYNTALGFYPTAIRVRYSTGGGGQVVVETTTNGALFTARGTISSAFANGDTLTAMANASGTVFVWKTSGATTTLLGQVTLPTTGANAFTTGSGRIGMFLPPGARVDNFAGGTVP